MPRTTQEYSFEHLVAAGIGARVERLLDFAGPAASYLLVLNTNGSLALSVHPMGLYPKEQLESIKASGKSFVFYGPLEDGMEYIWLQWHKLDLATMEGLIGGTFDAGDLVSTKSGKAIDYPESWSVMF